MDGTGMMSMMIFMFLFGLLLIAFLVLIGIAIVKWLGTSKMPFSALGFSKHGTRKARSPGTNSRQSNEISRNDACASLFQKGTLMSNELELTREKQQIRQPAEGLPENGPACHVSGSGWLKGGFVMAICCAAPLLLVAALAFFGLSLGAITSGALSLAAVLACPSACF